LYFSRSGNTVASGTQYPRLIRNPEQSAYILSMPRKPIELPPAVARAFVRDMEAFFAEKNQIRPTRSRLANSMRSSSTTSGKLKLTDVKAMFVAMRDSPS
jgi:hypothetical protein